MSLSRKELIQKLETISALYNKTVAIKEKMDAYTPDDNYERKVTVPRFPGVFQDERARATFRDRVDHTDPDALELMSQCYDNVFSPKRPIEPPKPRFNAPSNYDNEKSQKNIGCFSYAMIGLFVCALIGHFDSKDKITLCIAAAAVALFILLRIIIIAKKDAAKKKVSKARAEHDKKINEITVQYNNTLKAYEGECTAHKSKRKVFLSEYLGWRKIYLESVAEENEISAKLEEERLAAVSKIKAEEFVPALDELNSTNDLISKEYLPAINVITDLIRSGRADDVKEAINLYEDILYRERQLQLEREKEQQRRREEELRREAEERHHREQMELLEEQEFNRQLEAEEQRKAEERRHQEEMDQRERMERVRRGQEYSDCIKQCNSCAYYFDCKVKFQRPNCSSFRPR